MVMPEVPGSNLRGVDILLIFLFLNVQSTVGLKEFSSLKFRKVIDHHHHAYIFGAISRLKCHAESSEILPV